MQYRTLPNYLTVSEWKEKPILEIPTSWKPLRFGLLKSKYLIGHIKEIIEYIQSYRQGTVTGNLVLGEEVFIHHNPINLSFDNAVLVLRYAKDIRYFVDYETEKKLEDLNDLIRENTPF